MTQLEPSWYQILAIIIPIVAAIIGKSFWYDIQALHRKRVFQKLIFRELEELSPFPEEPKEEYTAWNQHKGENFVHRDIFRHTSDNRDFILSLDPTLVFLVGNLWYAFDEGNGHKWLHFLEEICKYSKGNKKIQFAYDKWKKLIKSYNQKQTVLTQNPSPIMPVYQLNQTAEYSLNILPMLLHMNTQTCINSLLSGWDI